MTESGPTQGAERHAAGLEQRWTSHPWIARLLRALIFLVPLMLSFAFSITAGRVAPADQLGMNRWVWIFFVFVLANLLLFALRSLTNRLIPLVALMKLTLVFPDNAPSRTKAALRNSNSRTMLRNMEEARANGATTGETINGDYLVQLLKDVNDHDRLTRGHSERVRAYAELLGTELGLDAEDLNKLRWAALLHDVGKMSVPAEILNKKGRPDEEEWKILQNHPAAAIPLLEPLRDWLGDWLHAADQHHCRWDGKGYPSDLAGEDITLSGRIVAIADAYDVMTSTRSYKKPLSPQVARQELTDCAGAQFDPNLVRAFLRIGLGRLKTIAGPLAWLANLGGSAQLPIPAASATATGIGAAGAAAVAVVVVATNSVFAQPAIEAQPLGLVVVANEEVALSPIIAAVDVTVEAVAGTNFAIVLIARGPALDFTIGGAAHGEATLTGEPKRLDDGSSFETWQTSASYTSNDDYLGQDGFGFEACDPDGRCDQGLVTIELTAAPSEPAPAPTTATSTTTTPPPPTTIPVTATIPATATTPTAPTPTPATRTTSAPTTATTTAPTTTTTAAPTTTTATTTTTTTPVPPVVNASPLAADDSATVSEDASVSISVLANDSDPDGDTLTVSGVGAPLHGVANIVGSTIRYTPDPDYNGTDRFAYTVGDGVNPSVVGAVDITVDPVNDAPVITVPDASLPEGAAIGTIVTSSIVSDVDDSTFTYSLSGDVAGQIAADPRYSKLASRLLGGAAPKFAIDADGVIRTAALLDYESNQAHELFIEVSDGTATVTTPVEIQVVDVDEAPTADGDAASTDEDRGVDIFIRVNDSDPEMLALSWNVPRSSAKGGMLSEADGIVSYTPPTNFNGTDTFTYTVADPTGLTSAPATVTISVGSINDAPVAVDDNGAGYQTNEDTTFTTPDVTTNDTDVDEAIDPSTIAITTDATKGTLTNNNDGTFGYTPDLNTNGNDTFAYTVTDTNGLASAPATVTISVWSINDAPVAVDDVLTVVDSGAATTIDLRGNDTDAENDVLTITGVTNGSSGTVSDNGDGTATYTHDGTEGSSDTFTYTVSDPVLGTDTATVVVTITPRPDFDGVGVGDNCPSDFNPNQFDSDGDGIGDACDAMPTVPSGAAFSDGQVMTSDFSVGVAAADFDSDGNMDLVFANTGEPNQVWLNVPLGTLAPTAQNLGGDNTRGVAVGDFNGDGETDIVFANDGSGNTVWLNNGSASFTSNGQTLTNSPSWDVEVGDFDADGDLDLVFANYGEPNRLWLNDSDGQFTLGTESGTIRRSKGVSVSDLNGDGFLDFTFSNDGQEDTVWLNNGAGGFAGTGLSLGTDRSHENVLADLDSDGDLDIAIAGDIDGDTIWLNDGTGQFTQVGPMIGLGHSRSVDAGDIDGDGDIDLAFGDYEGANSIWLNDGTGLFIDSLERLGDDDTEDVVLVDLDGDGDLDLIAANDGDANLVYLNIDLHI